MKLLIVTQVIDTEHPILGFFHRWVEEFATQCEQVQVICQQVGKHNLPTNVTIHSLGKESGANKLTQLWRFYKYSWQLRHEYDAVFVHMIPLYVIIGGPLWRVLHKKIGLWYTHGSVPFSLKVADLFVYRIFTASEGSCNLNSNKVQVTGHGIDTDHFKPVEGVKKDIDLITVGRIAKSKNLQTLVDILVEVRKEHDVSLTIVGVSVTEEEKRYEAELRAHIQTQNLTNYVHFVGRVSQADLPNMLNRAKVFVTTAQNGSLDKAMLEAMACGLPIISNALGSKTLPIGEMQVSDNLEFIKILKNVLKSHMSKNLQNIDFVEKKHSLKHIFLKIYNMQGK